MENLQRLQHVTMRTSRTSGGEMMVESIDSSRPISFRQTRFNADQFIKQPPEKAIHQLGEFGFAVATSHYRTKEERIEEEFFVFTRPLP